MEHVPIRTCVGCRTRRPQAELVRCVLGGDGVAHVDRHAAGRGAWVCGAECAAAAIGRRGFERAWRIDRVDRATLERLSADLTNLVRD